MIWGQVSAVSEETGLLDSIQLTAGGLPQSKGIVSHPIKTIVFSIKS
jgi:hypothetical protein